MRLDNDLDYLLTQVNKELDNDLNIMIVSDHVLNKEKINHSKEWLFCILGYGEHYTNGSTISRRLY